MAPRSWSELAWHERVRRCGAVAVVVLMALCALHRLAPARSTRWIPGPANLVLKEMGRTFRLAGRWNMFGSPPLDRPIIVEGRAHGERWFVLASPFDKGWDLWRRVVDARLRKFHQKFADGNQRARLGPPYLEYLCRVGEASHPGMRQARLVQLPHPYRDRGRAARRITLLRHRCGDLTPVRPSHRAPASSEEGV